MNRFKTSKYRNSVAKCGKKEKCISDLFVETCMSSGNHVKCGVKYLASNINQTGGGKIAIFSTSDSGRKGNAPFLAAHGSSVTDFDLSPFHHDKLLTASEDHTVKLWSIPKDLEQLKSITPDHVIKGFDQRPELVFYHPIADGLATVTTGDNIHLYDLERSEIKREISFCDGLIQSACWSLDGALLGITTKSKKLKIKDVRSDSSSILESSAHDNHKDSRVCWLSSSKLLTSGFGRSRSQEIKVWDSRNLGSCLYKKEFGTSTGILMTFFDQDTNLLFVGGKGDSSLSILEFKDSAEVITEGNSLMMEQQTKGLCLAPKWILDVIQCEVDRLYQLSKTQIQPISIQVPRRIYHEFQPDLFPYTASDEVVLSAGKWLEGQNTLLKMTSLDPNKRKPKDVPEKIKTEEKIFEEKKDEDQIFKDEDQKKELPENNNPVDIKVELFKPKNKTFIVAKTSKFRHWTANVDHLSTHLTNITNLQTTSLGSNNGLSINLKRAAFPLSTAGGHLAVVELSRTGRQPVQLSTVENKAVVVDFSWNPFNDQQLAVGLDTGVIKLWTIPVNGLTNSLVDASFVLEGHNSRVSSIMWHPLACDVIATSGFDSRFVVWNTKTSTQVAEIDVGAEILHSCWSLGGSDVAVVTKGGNIFKFDPRKPDLIKVGTLPGGCKSARLIWVIQDQFIFASYINKNGARCISLLSSSGEEIKDLTEVDHGVALLIPHYDEDTNVIFLSAKGDHSLISFEVSFQDPYITPLTSFRSDLAYQSFCFLPKTSCDVTKVEFARAWKLSKNSLEPISFVVPRVKMEYFQDDLFPETKKVDQPSMTAEEYFAGCNKQMVRTSLQPRDMKPLSQAPKEAPKERKYDSYNADTYKTDEQRREELVAAMSAKLNLDKKLEQDDMEGVDEDEWSD